MGFPREVRSKSDSQMLVTLNIVYRGVVIKEWLMLWLITFSGENNRFRFTSVYGYQPVTGPRLDPA